MMRPRKILAPAMIILSVVYLTGCNPQPEKIAAGKDNCAELAKNLRENGFTGKYFLKLMHRNNDLNFGWS